MSDRLLLVDGESGLLLVDGESFLLLAASSLIVNLGDATIQVEAPALTVQAGAVVHLDAATVGVEAPALIVQTAPLIELDTATINVEAPALNVTAGSDGIVTLTDATVEVHAPALIVATATTFLVPEDPDNPGQPGTYPPDDPPNWAVKIEGGADLSTANLVNVDHVEFTGASHDVAQITVARNHPDANLFQPFTYMQVWRGTDMLTAGYLVADDPQPGGVACTIVSPDLILFQRRQLGKLRDNLLKNPRFTDGLTHWAAEGVTAAHVTDPHLRDEGAAKLTQASEGADTFLRQLFTETGTGVGTLLTFVAYVLIDPTEWVGPAVESRGLWAQAVHGGEVVQVCTEFDQHNGDIDDDTPRGGWERLVTALWVPPDETWDIDLRLYAPGGVVFWDAAQAVRMESLSTARPGDVFARQDLARFFARAVRWIQDPANGWSDLRVGTNLPDSGTLITRHQQFAEHLEFARLRDEFADRDYEVWLTQAPGVRVLKGQSPRRARDRTSLVLDLRTPGNPAGIVAEYRWPRDGLAAETRAVTLSGQSQGPDREEGYAEDSSMTGGVVLGGVHATAPGTPIDSLDPIARSIVDTNKAPVVVGELTVISPHSGTHTQQTRVNEVIHDLEPGDLVTVRIDDAPWRDVDGTYRVSRKRVHGDDTTLVSVQEVLV